MNRKTNLDKFQEVMFNDMATLDNLTPVEQDQVRRYRFAFAICLDNPSVSDNLLRDQLMGEFDISMSQAYRDISNIKVILPNIRNAGKEWIRYIVNEELKEAIATCKLAGNAKLKELVMAIDKLAKYNKLDQDDAEQMPWDEIIPQEIEPTGDISVLGVVPMPDRDNEIKRLYEKYKGEIEIEDIDYQEVTDDREKENILQ